MWESSPGNNVDIFAQSYFGLIPKMLLAMIFTDPYSTHLAYH